MADRTALQLAQELRGLLADAGPRIEIAGSVRRGKPDPHDIEIVAQWAPELDNRLLELQMLGRLQIDPTHKADGPRYKRRLFDGFPVDIFIVRPPYAQWGLIFFIRTGPAQYSQQALADWKRLTGGGYSKEGCLYDRDGVAHVTPEEADVFVALRRPYARPEERR